MNAITGAATILTQIQLQRMGIHEILKKNTGNQNKKEIERMKKITCIKEMTVSEFNKRLEEIQEKGEIQDIRMLSKSQLDMVALIEYIEKEEPKKELLIFGKPADEHAEEHLRLMKELAKLKNEHNGALAKMNRMKCENQRREEGLLKEIRKEKSYKKVWIGFSIFFMIIIAGFATDVINIVKI